MYFDIIGQDFIFICALMVTTLIISTSNAEPLDNASYEGLKPDEFMTKWLILGSIPVSAEEKPSEEVQKEAFNNDFLSDQGGESAIIPTIEMPHSIKGQEYKWQIVSFETDEVDLVKIFGEKNFVIAYAYTEIEMQEKMKALFGVGSDDGIKIWLNGKLIHEKWIGRPLNKDNDLVPVTFQKGKNHLLLKIQNMQMDWGFVCRMLSSLSVAERFITAAGMGNLDDLKMMLEHGIDINITMEPGLTALHNAKIRGRKDAMEFLLEKGADPNIPMPPKEELANAVFNRVIKGNSPGASILIAQSGEIIYQNGFGFADVGNRVPFTVETKSRIGSITKQFTASAILKLQEEGKLNLDDKLSKFIHDFPRGDELTIHHLLTHTSGIHSYTSKQEFMKTVTMEISPEDLINSFKNDKFDFDPGEKFLYNNSGYFLLGYIIGKVSGQSYGDYLKNIFFEPLGMKDTGVHQSKLILENEAYGYSYVNGKFQKATNWDMSQAGGAGSLYSTLGDLYRWNEAIFNGRVLSKESLDAAFTSVKLNDGNVPKDFGGGYGYGWLISEARGMKVISHGGGLNGFNSQLLRIPDLNATVIVLQNCIPPPTGMSADELAYEVGEIFFGDQMGEQESFAVDEGADSATYDDYIGSYDYTSAVLTVTKENDKLFAQMAGQPKFEIFPSSKDKFFWKVVDAQIDFVRDEKGKVTHAIHHQGGSDLTVQKLEEEQIAKVDPDIYDDYAGKYQFTGIGVLTIAREGDKIFAQMTGQPKVEIFPSSETEFFYKIVNARVKFVKNENGKIVKAIISQSGMNFEGTKIK